MVVRPGDDVTVAAGGSEFAYATCQPGERATGVGGVNANTNGVHLKQSFPDPLFSGSTPNAWGVSYHNATGSPVAVRASVVCASP